MEMTITLGALAAGLAIAGLAVWAERRPRDSLDPRLIPTTPIMFVGVLMVLLALVHLMTLFGVQTGRRQF